MGNIAEQILGVETEVHYFLIKCKATHYSGYYLLVKGATIEEASALAYKYYPDYLQETYDIIEPNIVQKAELLVKPVLVTGSY